MQGSAYVMLATCNRILMDRDSSYVLTPYPSPAREQLNGRLADEEEADISWMSVGRYGRMFGSSLGHMMVWSDSRDFDTTAKTG